MNHFYTTGLSILFAIALTPVVAQADDMPDRGPMPFSAFDKDGNGIISEQEFTDVHNKRMAKRAEQGYKLKKYGMYSFSDIDKDGNGEINEQEFAAYQEQCRMKPAK